MVIGNKFMLLGISALNNSVTRTEQFNGREGETAALLKRSLVSLTLRVFGFAPRQFNR